MITENGAKLIARHVGRHTLEPEKKWRRYRYKPPRDSTLMYGLQVNCARPYYGSKCSKVSTF